MHKCSARILYVLRGVCGCIGVLGIGLMFLGVVALIVAALATPFTEASSPGTLTSALAFCGCGVLLAVLGFIAGRVVENFLGKVEGQDTDRRS